MPPKAKQNANAAAASGGSWDKHNYATLMNEVRALVEPKPALPTVEQALQAAKEQVNSKKINDPVHIWGAVYLYVSGVRAEDPAERLSRAHAKMETSPLKGYTDYTESNGLLLSEKDVVLGLVRYQLLDSAMLRAKYGSFYRALRDHLRVFSRPCYALFQQIMWSNVNSLISYIFVGDISETIGAMGQMIYNFSTLAPDILGRGLLDLFKARVMQNLPDPSGFAGHNRFVLLSSCIVIALAAVSDLLLSKKMGNLTPLVAWLVEELNKLVVRSSFRYKNVLRVFIRVLNMLGPKRAQDVVSVMSMLQTPAEAMSSFMHLPTFQSLDKEIAAGNRTGLKERLYGMLDSLDREREMHRLKVPMSSLGFWR